ncbi:MAG: hypothetical protein ACR2F1_12900 [Nitrososphaeraceae archaeon]
MAKLDCLKRIDDYRYRIQSQWRSNNIYEIVATELGFVCSCQTTSLGE